MINMNYSDWNSVCQSVFNIGNDLKYYLQWYPFYKLSKTNKEHISSENFLITLLKTAPYLKSIILLISHLITLKKQVVRSEV